MHEDFETIISRGVKSWVRNLNLCAPFVLSSLVNLIFFVLLVGLIGFLFFSSGTGSIIDPAALTPQELYSTISQKITENILLFLFLILLFFLFEALVQSFFTAGAIGMAKKVTETGDTDFSDMLTSGSKNVFRLFLATLLITLLLFAGIIFIVPGALAVGNLNTLIENTQVPVWGITALVFGALIWVIYMIAISLLLSLTSYALVIDELEPFEALTASFRFFMKNKMEVLFLWFLFIGLALFNAFVREFIGSKNVLLAGLTYLVTIIVLQPLAAVLWTRLYLSRKGKKLYNPSELLSDPEKL
jgi:drug/metabolite transporter (DMT)-like permease